jgi:putative transposase
MMAGMIPLILTGLLGVLSTRRALVLENLALRHQLAVLQRTAPRPRLRTTDRLLWVLLSRLWNRWTDAVSIVQPATVIRWQQTGFKLFWTWKTRRNGPGRPAVAPEVRTLIRRMSQANLLWGTPRIHGELQKLGVEISQAAVSKYLVRHRRPPSQTWRTFLDNHLGCLVAVDLFVVPTAMFKVLFVFVVLAHDRRRVVHINVTDTPTAQWTAKQLVEAFFASAVAASLQGRVALGLRAGQPVRRLRSAATATSTGRRSARREGFSLHADVAVPARRRDQLEKVCRDILRPPLARERLTESLALASDFPRGPRISPPYRSP